MDEIKNKSSTACEDLEAKTIRKELRRTVENYSRVIDMIDNAPHLDEPIPKSQEPHSWRFFLNKVFKQFKMK